MSTHQIRKALPQDIESIIELCEDHSKYEGADYDKLGKADRLSGHLFSKDSMVKCLVVVVDDQVRGYATFIPEFSTWDAAYYLHMDCLYLKPETRGMGIGREIMNIIKKEAKTENYHLIQWQTPVNNTKAIDFYKKIGATSSDKVRFYLSL